MILTLLSGPPFLIDIEKKIFALFNISNIKPQNIEIWNVSLYKECDFRDDCTEFILSISLYSGSPATMNLFLCKIIIIIQSKDLM